ncbi:MAG: DUF4386 family protein [Frankiaceae bacterium]|nr:DUF4386 family protein [Frankiaceae bacterium]
MEATPARTGLIGNRLALAGAVLYLLEWVAIIASTPPGPFAPGTSASKVMREYADNADKAVFAAAWFAIVLVGRVLYIAGVKASLRNSARDGGLLDLALGAMAISVVIEVISYGIAAAAAQLADSGAEQGVVLALDRAAYWVNLMIWGPIGVAVLACAVAMLRSRLFATWLTWVGIVAGIAGLAACLLFGATTTSDEPSGAGEALMGLTALPMWVWMIGTGVVLWRRTSSQDNAN